MKKTRFLLSVCLWLACCPLRAEAGRVLATENNLVVKFGGIWLSDEYLSALPYSGRAVHLQNDWWRYFTAERTDFSHTGRLELTGAQLYNSAYSNRITAFGANGSWGAYYNYRPMGGLTLLGGVLAEVDVLAKYMVRSVNKPYSMDLAANLLLSGGVRYDIARPNTAYRLRYLIRTPLAGCMFVPEMGGAYYEMLFSLKNTIHGSFFTNKAGLRHELTFDMRFKTTTWRLGVEHEYLQYHANNLRFCREQVSLVVGCIFNTCAFGGRRQPDNIQTVW